MTTSLLSTRPAAVVFDIDGLLMDTEPCWTVAETELFARRGRAFGDAEKARIVGRSLPDACAELAVDLGEPGGGAALEEELLGLVTAVVEESAVAMEGAHAIVDLAAARVPVAVASNSRRSLVRAALRRGGFAGRFPVELSADDVAAPKPAPDLYLAAAAALAVAPTSCVAFEDSPTGVRSARAAGTPCVGVPSLAGVALEEADLVVPALTDPTLLDWLRTW